MSEIIEKQKSEQQLIEKYKEAIKPLVDQLVKIHNIYFSPVYTIRNGEIVSMEVYPPPNEVQEMIKNIEKMIEFIRNSTFKQ